MLPVTISGVVKSYDGKVRVLDGIDLAIAGGELFFLLGGSGCGKTTLLRLIGGFHAPDAGSVRFGERDVTRLPVEERGIGMVFQHYALWPHLTVGENVAFGLDVRKVATAEKRKRVDEALELVALPAYRERRVAELSGGQQQRVALARAIVVRPALLLLDEPLSNLDARLRAQMRSEIRRICKAAGSTAIYVTHDQGEALATADRIAVMAGGRVAQVGTPRALYERPATRTVAEFLGEANLLPATMTGPGRVRCAFAELDTAAILPAAGRAVTVCIRPERVRLAEDGFPGVIESGQFFGPSAAWTVRCGPTALSVAESAAPARQPGDAVRLRIAADDVVVLTA